MQKAVFFLLFAAAAGCCTSVNRRPVLETEVISSPAAERANAVFPDEAAPAPAMEQAAQDPPRLDTPAAEAEPPANQALERVEWTHNRRHFKKWREEIREMHKEFDKLLFELEAEGTKGPQGPMPPSHYPPPQQ